MDFISFLVGGVVGYVIYPFVEKVKYYTELFKNNPPKKDEEVKK